MSSLLHGPIPPGWVRISKLRGIEHGPPITDNSFVGRLLKKHQQSPKEPSPNEIMDGFCRFLKQRERRERSGCTSDSEEGGDASPCIVIYEDDDGLEDDVVEEDGGGAEEDEAGTTMIHKTVWFTA